MLAVPALVGTARSGPTGIHLLLITVLFAGYFCFNAAGLALRARRTARFVRPLCVYGSLALLPGLAVLVLNPMLSLWAAVYLPLAGISLFYSWRRQDRALGNDAVTILAACLYAGVTFQAGAAAPTDTDRVTMAWVVVALFAYFFGTALYVKTVIRERRNRTFHRVSLGYHLAWTLAWAALVPFLPLDRGAGWGLVVFFAVLTARAWWMAGRTVKPAYVGAGESVASVVLLVLLLAW